MNSDSNREKESRLRRYGEWAIVTGASSGLGLEFARLLAAQGMNCVLVALEQDRLDTVAAELNSQHGTDCRALAIDLATESGVDQLVKSTADIEVGMLVNNAGIGCSGAFATRDPARIKQLVLLNCLAPTMLTRAYLPEMLRRGAGAIIIVSSLQAFISPPFVGPYCASKAYGLQFGESLWGELRDSPIDVITVCPAGMQTEFFQVDGFSDQDCRRMHRVSSTPESIASLTLRKLGKKPVAMPYVTLGVSLLARLLPRRWRNQLANWATLRLVTMEKK